MEPLVIYRKLSNMQEILTLEKKSQEKVAWITAFCLTYLLKEAKIVFIGTH